MGTENEALTVRNLRLYIEDEGTVVCADDRCPCPGDESPLGMVPHEIVTDGSIQEIRWGGISADWLASVAVNHLEPYAIAGPTS